MIHYIISDDSSVLYPKYPKLYVGFSYKIYVHLATSALYVRGICIFTIYYSVGHHEMYIIFVIQCIAIFRIILSTIHNLMHITSLRKRSIHTIDISHVCTLSYIHSWNQEKSSADIFSQREHHNMRMVIKHDLWGSAEVGGRACKATTKMKD